MRLPSERRRVVAAGGSRPREEIGVVVGVPGILALFPIACAFLSLGVDGGLVMCAFFVDGLGAVLGSGGVRRGIVSPRVVAVRVASRAMTAAVGRHRVGNGIRLPGWVV